jgi:hypothetical protein
MGVVAVGLAALLARPAAAQFRGGGGFGGAGQLVGQKAVQDELKLDKDQIDKADAAIKKVREDHKDDLAKARDQNTSMEERAEIMKKVADDTEKALKDVLKPDQLKRLKQIQLQVRGVGAFAQEEVQTALKLTQEQKDDIKTIAEDTRKGTMEAFQGAAGDPTKFADVRKKVQALNAEGMDRISKILKDDQKKSWQEMIGDKFDQSKLEFGPRRGAQ